MSLAAYEFWTLGATAKKQADVKDLFSLFQET